MFNVSEPAKDPRQGGLCRCEATPAPPTISSSLWLKANYSFTSFSHVIHPLLQIPFQFRNANRLELSSRSPTKPTAARSAGHGFLLWIDEELEKPVLVLVGKNWGMRLAGRSQKDNGHKSSQDLSSGSGIFNLVPHHSGLVVTFLRRSGRIRQVFQSWCHPWKQFGYPGPSRRSTQTNCSPIFHPDLGGDVPSAFSLFP